MMIRYSVPRSSRNIIKSNEALYNLILTYASLGLRNQREKQFSHQTTYKLTIHIFVSCYSYFQRRIQYFFAGVVIKYSPKPLQYLHYFVRIFIYNTTFVYNEFIVEGSRNAVRYVYIIPGYTILFVYNRSQLCIIV